MVRIRLRRTGKKKQPSYRVVVADSEAPRDGRFIENIGFYGPRTDPPTVEIDADRALYWLSQGAQPSEAVARLLRKEGILARLEALKSGQAVTEPLEPAEAAPEAEAEAQAAPEAAVASEVEAVVPEEAVEEEAGAESTSEEEIEAQPEGESAAEKE